MEPYYFFLEERRIFLTDSLCSMDKRRVENRIHAAPEGASFPFRFQPLCCRKVGPELIMFISVGAGFPRALGRAAFLSRAVLRERSKQKGQHWQKSYVQDSHYFFTISILFSCEYGHSI